MKRKLFFVGLFFISTSVGAAEPAGADQFWAQWRGPNMNGIAPHGNPPIEWAEDKNIVWKVRVPGLGSATPVIWEDRLYLLAAVPTGGKEAVPPPPPRDPDAPRSKGQRRSRPAPVPIFEQEFVVLAINRDDGSVAWQRTARKEVPHENKQRNNSFASASAITDGSHLIAYFGSRGLYCFDMDGNLQWEKDLGDMQTRREFGEGASPALYGDRIVVNWDHEGQSFIVALDKRTGKELWRRERDEVTSWATPLVVEHKGTIQVVTSGTNKVRSYDLTTGETIWEGPGLTVNSVPTPIESGGVIYVAAGYRGNVARAIRLDGAKGDITGSPAILWEVGRDTPYVPSPLLYGDFLYLTKSNSGILSVLDKKSGQVHYGPLRLERISEIYASPVGAAGRVYILGRDGNALVLENGAEHKILARNSLEDGFDASPAIVGQEMYLRGYRYLYKIAEAPEGNGHVHSSSGSNR
jgi:outer membrane protein assembly factor BamB